MEKRRNGAISPLFHNIFNISQTSGVKLHFHLLNVAVRFIFSSILQIGYVVVRISRCVSESPFDFEIMRVDCVYGETVTIYIALDKIGRYMYSKKHRTDSKVLPINVFFFTKAYMYMYS